MSLTASAIRLLADKGLSASDIADIAEANSAKPSAAAVRQKRYRDNKRDVTRNVTPPPNDIYSNPPSDIIPDGISQKRERRKRIDHFPCPDGVDALDWDALKANRQKKRAALSAGAYRQIISKLDKWREAGWPPGPIVAEAAERGWTTVFETETMKLRDGRNGQHRQTRNGAGSEGDGFTRALRRASEKLATDDFGGVPRDSSMGASDDAGDYSRARLTHSETLGIFGSHAAA